MQEHKATFRRTAWGGLFWVRYLDFFGDREFQIRELEGSRGTWHPFFVIFSEAERSLLPWTPTAQDLLATDWEEVKD